MNALFIVLFAAAYLVLYVGYSAVPQRLLTDLVYYYGIVCPSKTMINWISPGEHAIGAHNTLLSATVNFAVVRGCDGSGVMFLLIAAIVAARAHFKRTLLGIAGAFAWVYVFNLLRIVALYFVASRWPAWFPSVHFYFIPTLMILLATLYFALWASHRYGTEHAAQG